MLNAVRSSPDGLTSSAYSDHFGSARSRGMGGHRRSGGTIVGTVVLVLSLLLASQPVSALGPQGPSKSSTVGTRITTPLPPVVNPRTSPLTEGVGNSWKALNQAAYTSAKAAANSAAGGAGQCKPRKN